MITQHNSLSYFSKILTPEITVFLNSTSELTVFVPVDEAWGSLDPYERLYLESEFANDDLQRILNMHAVVAKDVKWSDTFDTGVTCGHLIEAISCFDLLSSIDHRWKTA